VSVRTATVLGDVSSALVHALKYGGWGGLAGPMARRMSRGMPEGLRDPLFVPVPTSPWRSRLRGYNQASLLAQALTSIVGLPTVEAVRREGGRTQVRLGPRERRRNVSGAFVLRERIRSRIRGRDVIVVDDVLTTGATASSVTLALGGGGVKSVHLLAFARALPFREGRLA
jgi:ComF family protein